MKHVGGDESERQYGEAEGPKLLLVESEVVVVVTVEERRSGVRTAGGRDAGAVDAGGGGAETLEPPAYGGLKLGWCRRWSGAE